MKAFRPMLSGDVSKIADGLAGVSLPKIVSPKLDGIRCIIRGGVAVSRNLKPIPNRYVQEVLSMLPDGLDGELIVGDATGNDVMNRTSSGVMSEDGKPNFTYCVFDMYTAEGGFEDRLAQAAEIVAIHDDERVVMVAHIDAATHERIAEFEENCVAAGFEGVMLRSPKGPYKFGRSTEREGYLLKLKRFEDAEAEVTGSVERFHNTNVAVTNALGLTERSTHKGNKKPTGMLGALVCEFYVPTATQDFNPPVQFEVGSGFTDAQRQALWDAREELPGKLVKFKYQNLTPDGVPRFPVFLGFRDERDL